MLAQLLEGVLAVEEEDDDRTLFARLTIPTLAAVASSDGTKLLRVVISPK